MMFRNYVLAVAVLAVFAPTSVSSQGSGFALIGQEITSPSLPAAAAAAPVEATEADGSVDVDFGTMVSLSANGKRMAVGAPGFDYRTTSTSTTTNESKNDAGAVFLYDLVYNPDTSEYTWETNLSMLPLYGQDSAEGIGRYLWLSPNGERLAVRRGDGTVQVYSTTNDDAGDDTATATTDADSHSHIQIGSTVTDCLGGAVELTDEYLVTSCDRFDANRGKVQVYQLVADNGDGNSGGTWELVVEIEGDAAGDRFGWRTTLDETPDDNRLFRLAVSAPNHDDKTGLVRSYIVNGNGDAQQFGQDLKGQEPGEQFGFAIAMSRQSPDPFLAVGVPQAAAGGDARGSIRIYSYSNNDGVALLNDEWALSAEFAGPEDRVRLGRDVAITANGDRAAASTFRSAQFAGLVTVYERTGGTNFELSSDLFGQDPLDRFGSNVALSATGSIIASGSIKRQNDAEEAVGSVRVFLDTSPFCSEPLEEFTQVADLETFFERQTCRRGNTLATTAEACSSDSIDGQDEPCEWQESASSSVAPSASPTRTTAEDLLPWSLEACPCDDMGYCILEPLTKGSELGICISGSISDIELVSVEKCRLEQGSNRVVLIDETGLDSSLFSASYICTDGACVIRTPVDATFFGTGRPDSLVVTGTVRVASRRSRSLRGVARELQYDRGEFSVNVALSRGDDDEDNSGESKKKKDENLGLSSPLWIVLAFLVALVIGCCCCITAKRQGENNARDLRGKSRKQVSEKEIEEFSFN